MWNDFKWSFLFLSYPNITVIISHLAEVVMSVQSNNVSDKRRIRRHLFKSHGAALRIFSSYRDHFQLILYESFQS